MHSHAGTSPVVMFLAVALLLSGCSTAPRTGAPLPPSPAESTFVPPTFPPIPRIIARLDLRVVYPREGALVQARDSNFIFGSVGSGDARLTINGQDVRVLPNGSFLAWLPLPHRDDSAYRLLATRGSDSARVIHRIARPPVRPALAEAGPLVVDSASLTPRGQQSRLPNDPVRVSIRAPRNASVALVTADGRRFPLLNMATVGGADPTLWATDVEARNLGAPATLVAARGADTVVLAGPRIARVDSLGRRYAVLAASAAAAAVADSDRVVIARPVAGPGATYKWFLLPGTVVELTGRSGDAWRARLDRDLDVWIDAAEVTPLPPGAPSPARVAGNARVYSRGPEWSDVVIPVGVLPPFSVDETSDGLELTLHGTVANTDIINFATNDSIVRRVTWQQVTTDRARYRIELHEPVYGYLARWERGAFTLRVRRAPRIDTVRPLEGLTIAVDAGHPPAGSTGPTGLYEGVATLAIANRLKTTLELRGARVVMTRVAPGAVALGERPVIARRANAHAFVSIHLNALPDGVNPWSAEGTGAYYFNARSEPLARAVQRGMVRRMGLRDIGINYDNLAVLRPTWMPSVLCEGAFIMIPEQEAALRTPEFQEAYALGVAEGLEAYFRGLAGARR